MTGFILLSQTDIDAHDFRQEDIYRKLTRLHDGLRYEVSMAAFSDALTEIEDLLLKAYHGEEDEADGGDEDLGDP